MVFLGSPLSALAAAALWASARAASANGDLSFGHAGRISSDNRNVANFRLVGNPDKPQVLSNKVILTPPVLSNQRGAFWGEKELQDTEWTADIDFRVTGPERGSGNLQIWYAARGVEDIKTSSIYTAGKFDGLALVIDQYSGSAGYIRGFLNDGTIDYRSHHNVDSLAFGHCEYAYRNLGRASKISIRQTEDNFRVEVDRKLCFESPKIRLPTGNNFGVTAASAESPDSFELFKFIVTTESQAETAQTPNPDPKATPADGSPKTTPKIPLNKAAPGSIPSFSSDPPEVPASSVAVDAQFADLHNRLQAMMKHITALSRDTSQSHIAARRNADDLESKLTRVEHAVGRLDALAGMEKRLGEIQDDVRQTKADLHNALDKHVSGLKTVLRDTHQTTLGSIASSAPGVLRYVLVVVAGQLVTVGAYVLWKRRKAAGPKKYL